MFYGNNSQPPKHANKENATIIMNKDVMRYYYALTTKIETVVLKYKLELHRLFITLYSQLVEHIIEQKFMNKKGIIINNKKLSLKE
ncbi:hypothetical protein HZH66_002504 [Vespula vulgaris]|uniref:Uncharacterized protein n=1 Tax=Vespula vulgaris TaxID=7454 RepID=A0A834KLA0_VESVU|nr:hypothetical protein HZH66_002504 [Vespula vulgaris]